MKPPISLTVDPDVAETMRQAGGRDERFSADVVGSAARLAVATWARAADGDESALAGMDPNRAHFLVHPPMKGWYVAPGPKVTRIEVAQLNTEPRATQIPVAGYEIEPVLLRVGFRFDGRKRFDDPGRADEETTFVGHLELRLPDSGPWRLYEGYVDTLDDFLGYTFSSRRETAEEYSRRTGSPAPPQVTGPLRHFRVLAGFADDDVKFGAEAQVQVQRETAPTREEAVELVQPAVWEETTRALGEGDWRPTIRRVIVTELLGE